MAEDFADDSGNFLATLDESVASANILRPEKHLSSPITTSLLERLLTLTASALAENRHVRPTQFDPHRSHCVEKYLMRHPELCYSSIKRPIRQYIRALDHCLKTPEILDARHYPDLMKLSQQSPYRLQTDYALSKQIFEDELTAYCSHLTDILTPAAVSEFKAKVRPPRSTGSDLVLSSARAQLWSDIVDQYRMHYRRTKSTIRHVIGPVRAIFGDGFALIKTDSLERWQLCTYEQLQMLQDACLARANVDAALRFSFHNGTAKLQAHVNDVLLWQESVLRLIGNEGYELIKAPEAVFKARLNELTDGDLLEYSSYSRTMDKMKEKERKLHGSTYLMDLFHQLAQRVTDLHDVAELFGLAKLSGHPTVYAHRSAASVRKEAEPAGTILPRAVKNMIRMFKHLTLSGYIGHHQSWPKMLCPPPVGSALRRHQVNQVTTLPLGSYPLAELDAVEFGQFVEYDYSEDYLKFLDDKAICPGATEMSKFWFGGARQESRRLLQHILEREHFDTRSMIDRLSKGKFRPEEMVIELTQKERELKTAARCFCKLPFEVRTFFTSTEYNLKEHFMKKYMPQQTMTMSNTETKTRLYNLVKNAKSKDRTLLEVDFSRWNLRWRHATVIGIARILGRIFGMPDVFSWAHWFFERATVVMTDKHTLPTGAAPNIPITQWPQSDLVWRGTHLGGFEGIQQALWTACTIAMMYWVVHDQDVAFNMAGQGDNQVFAILFDPSKGSIADQLRKLLAVMEARCALLNHEVKPDECIDSQTVLTYSKDIYVEGNHVLYNLKFASRSFRREEIDIPSLSTEIAGASACAMACADSVYNTPKAIHWKTFLTLRLLSARYRSPVHTIERRALNQMLGDEEALKFALLLPGSLGGLPTMSWSRFFLKGEVDDLSWDMVAIYGLMRSNKTMMHDLRLLLDGQYTPAKIDTSQVILDPHSIPLSRPKDLKKLVKDAVEANLPAITKNKWMLELFSSKTTDAGDKLLQSLASTSPFYPQIMSDIYKLSPSGVSDALVSRFTMTRTIVGITGNPNFAVQIETANSRLIQFIMDRHRRAKRIVGLSKLPPSAYEACVAARKLWGENVDHKNIGVYNPFDFQLQYTDASKPMISASSRSTTESLHDSLGPYPPNFGTKTRQKLSDHGFKVTTSSSTVGDLKKLISTFSELGLDDSLGALISQITMSRSPWTTSELVSVLPTAYGGSAAHRHAAINASAFSILGSRTVPTHLNFCSDNAGVLSGGEYDYPIAFQEFYLSLTNVMQVLTYNDVLNSNASIGFALTDVYEALLDESVKCSATTLPKWEIATTNKLCYVSELELNEIPLVPPVSMIPHSKASEVPVAALIYNRLLAKYVMSQKLFLSTSAINLPIEILDMKEFNHCPLREIIRGVTWFIGVMALSVSNREYTKDATTFLRQAIDKMSNACACLLGRMMLHPDFNQTMFAGELGIQATPGSSGARSAADNLSGYLQRMSIDSLKSREFSIRRVPLILFQDYGPSAKFAAEAHASFLVASQHFKDNVILLTSYQRLTLRTARHDLFSNTTPLSSVLRFRAVVKDCATTRRKIGKPTGVVDEMVVTYVHLTPQEAVRALRDLPRDNRIMIRPELPCNIKFGRLRSNVNIAELPLDGSLSPQHLCVPRTDGERIVEDFAAKLSRPYMVYASATSIWHDILSGQRKYLVGKRVVTIGVGHGAVATAALANGASECVGVDLRSSFPIITQREGTYIPPEVLMHGYGAQFKWSSFVSRTGGNVIDHVDELSCIEPAQIWIIDIEQTLEKTIPVLESVPCGVTLFFRFFGCSDYASYIYDALNADAVYNTTALLRSHQQTWIIAVNSFEMFNSNANFKRQPILSVTPYASRIQRSNSHASRLANLYLAPLGEEVKVLSAPELDLISSRLLQRAQNCDDDQIRLKCETGAQWTALVALCFRNYTMITLEQLLELRKEGRALLGVWLANTALDLSDLLLRLTVEAGLI
nr:RNA-dependent RNA polymerase [Actinidia fungus negative-stranded RNA virus 2]